jgi:hypothetical protein
MKVVVKNIAQKGFEIEMEASSTVRDVKNRLNEQHAIGAPELLKLIFHSRVLVDDEMLNGTVNYSEDEFMVVMVAKAKAPAAASSAASPSASSAAPASAPARPPAQPLTIFIRHVDSQCHRFCFDENDSICHVLHAFCDKLNDQNGRDGAALLPSQVHATALPATKYRNFWTRYV